MTLDEMIRRVQVAQMLLNQLKEVVEPAITELLADADLRRCLSQSEIDATQGSFVIISALFKGDLDRLEFALKNLEQACEK